MQFLKEIWFVLLNVPALYQRYEKQAIWAGIFFLLSVATFVLERWFETHKTLLMWTRRVSLGLTALLFILAFVDLAKSRLPFDDLVCSEVEVDAYYHLPEEKSYELVQRQRCMNRTDVAIRDLRDIRDGYYENIPEWRVDGHVVQGPEDVRLAFISGVKQHLTNYVGQPDVSFYRQQVEFNAPLPSGADVDMVYRISAKGVPVDAEAFSNGTVWARSVDYDTLLYHLAIHAPAGFRFNLLEWGVVDRNGKRDSAETDRQKEPQLTGSGGQLEWHLVLARKNYSYMLKYRIAPYQWESNYRIGAMVQEGGPVGP